MFAKMCLWSREDLRMYLNVNIEMNSDGESILKDNQFLVYAFVLEEEFELACEFLLFVKEKNCIYDDNLVPWKLYPRLLEMVEEKENVCEELIDILNENQSKEIV